MNKTYHILNGDALLEFFPMILPGKIIVARECLVDGPTNGENLAQFWQTRAAFIEKEYAEDQAVYFNEVVSEFEKIEKITPNSEINLWFEEDLFCQVNLWFCISLLEPVSESFVINLVKPHQLDGKPDWRGFGAMTDNEMAIAYQTRQKLSTGEIQLLAKLWAAFKKQDRSELLNLSKSETGNFPILKDVIRAHTDRFSKDDLSGRPENVLKTIVSEKPDQEFNEIFREFSKREGIYGFGDLQIERLLKKLSDTGLIEPVK